MWWLLVGAAVAARDGDGDGVRDRDDRCPEAAEDVDGWLDVDGCVDEPVVVRIDVVDEAGTPLPDAAVVARSRDRATAARGGLLFSMDPGPLEVRAEASGYQSRSERVSVSDVADQRVRLVLQLVDRTGSLRVVVRDTLGRMVAGSTVQIDGGPVEAVADVVERMLPMGPHLVVVRAPGSGGARAMARVAAGEVVEAIVVLEAPRVIVQRERLDLRESIFFETGSAVIREESHDLLDEVALVVADHPEIDRLRVEGHTDSRGDDAANLRLSEDRAAAVVEALVRRGIDRQRLGSVGFGESMPLDAAESDAAWTRNRRVDLIVEQLREPPPTPIK